MMQAATFAMERALAAATRLDPDLAARLSEFAGHRIAIALSGSRTVVFQCREDGTWLADTGDAAAPPDLLIRASLPALLAAPALIRSGAGVESYGRAGIRFEGDLELARRLRGTIASFTFDWEELLSRAIGDLAAHRLGNGVRTLANVMSAARDATGRNITEQLQYGLSLLPARTEVEAFLRDIDRLRSDVDRLAARMRILAEEHGAPG